MGFCHSVLACLLLLLLQALDEVKGSHTFRFFRARSRGGIAAARTASNALLSSVLQPGCRLGQLVALAQVFHFAQLFFLSLL